MKKGFLTAVLILMGILVFAPARSAHAMPDIDSQVPDVHIGGADDDLPSDDNEGEGLTGPKVMGDIDVSLPKADEPEPDHPKVPEPCHPKVPEPEHPRDDPSPGGNWNLTIVKTDQDGKPLAGVEFELYIGQPKNPPQEPCPSPVVPGPADQEPGDTVHEVVSADYISVNDNDYEWILVGGGAYVTDQNGKFLVSNYHDVKSIIDICGRNQVFKLIELATVDGYMLLTDPFYLKWDYYDQVMVPIINEKEPQVLSDVEESTEEETVETVENEKVEPTVVKSANAGGVKTGDHGTAVLWLVIAAFTIMGAALIIRRREAA